MKLTYQMSQKSVDFMFSILDQQNVVRYFVDPHGVHFEIFLENRVTEIQDESIEKTSWKYDGPNSSWRLHTSTPTKNGY